MLSQVLLNATGPLPTSPVVFQSPVAGAPVLFYLGGSGYTYSPGVMTIQILLDGTVVQTASVYTSDGESHKSFVCNASLAQLSYAQHQITFVTNGFISDEHDTFLLTMVY
jgi:hypothetical protein